MELVSGKTRIAVIATLLLWNSIMCLSIENTFSSLLETVVDDSNLVIPEQFHIYGRNGFCAHAHDHTILKLFTCGSYATSETYKFHSDGTLRLTGGECLKASEYSEGSTIITTVCTTPPSNETLWKLLDGDRQIMHQSTGFVLTAIGGGEHSRLSLEVNVYSVGQTWLLLEKDPVSTKLILGMNNLCLHVSFDTQVWVGICEETVDAQNKWLIYPDATIRPQQNSSRCLSFNNLTKRTVLVTTCGLSLTNERWLFTNTGTVLSENVNMVLDVEDANPSLKRIIVSPASGGLNQQWSLS